MNAPASSSSYLLTNRNSDNDVEAQQLQLKPAREGSCQCCDWKYVRDEVW
jgi:hypothetical protein